MKKLLFSTLLAFFAIASLTFVACDKNDDPEPTPETPTIAGLAQNTANLSSLVAALKRADLVSVLDGTDKFTVFAPTNDAFAAFLTANGFANLEAVPVATLKQILLNHVITGEVKSTSLITGYVKTNATFGTTTSNLSLFVNTTSGVVLNNGIKVTSADIIAKNGVVHIVDQVIGIPSIVTAALSNPNFSTLVSALTRSDLGVDYVAVLSGAGPFTVFAPTNDAFTALLGELGATSLAAIDAATLNAVLQYHVVAGANVLSTQLTDEQVITTFQGGTLRVDLDGGAKLVDGKSRIANIVAVDVQCGNGVIHAIDKVVLPN
jgi:uncharacterized surface protein with fasciclin (FAS1) repeats